MARRLKAMGVKKYAGEFSLTLHEEELDTPFRWSKPRVVFVNSMSDLFHRNVPESFIQKVFSTMTRCPRHMFQVLTKRANRLKQINSRLPWSHNIWMGVSVEDKRRYPRIDALASTEAKIKFLSLEPLLGPLDNLPLQGIDWVIAGGESGPGARRMDRQWVIDIRDQCRQSGVPFFFKQWGGTNKKKTGRQLDGHTYDEMPARLTAA
jgi:protein gp37